MPRRASHPRACKRKYEISSLLGVTMDVRPSVSVPSGESASKILKTTRMKLKTIVAQLGSGLVCPISKSLMVDPVLTEDGISYNERK